MPSPKRRAPRRTAAAIGEDLLRARRVGGLWRADADDLAATLDWLSVTGVAPDEEPLTRARDLFVHYVKRTCEATREAAQPDLTAVAAAASLQQLLLRPSGDTRLAQVIRRESAIALRHTISPDAVRHREDKLITEIAQQVSQDLEIRRLDVPQSVEDAVHRLAPLVTDLRQDLHDLLCVIYAHVPPADPRQRRVIGGFYQSVLMEVGALLVACTDLTEVGRRSANLPDNELSFVSSARHMRSLLFEEDDDREYMLAFMGREEAHGWARLLDRLQSTERGKQVYDRWLSWVNACYPTCAFERTAEIRYMCSPHALLTLLYDFEALYVDVGYSPVHIPGTQPLRHHGLSINSK